MLAVQPLRGRQRDEELRPVGVGPRVGHGEDAGARVLQVGVDLVVKRLAVDRRAAAAGASRVAA